MKSKGILIILGIVFLVFALTTCFLILKIQRAGEIQRVKVQEKKEVAEIAPGKHVYEIITDNPRDPQIIEVEIDPLNVKVGENQIVRAKVKTLADSVRAEDFVSGKVICDEKTIDFSFKLKGIEGKEELITTWEGNWEREKDCNFEKNYQIKIFAKNIKGEDEVTLSLGSSCPTPTDGQNYVLSTTTVGSSGCIFSWNVNGVENGNIIVESGFTLTVGGTIAGGQTIVFNPGYSITINGSIALNKTSGYQGQIKKAYICAKNSDADSYYAYGVDTSDACGNFGGQRRYTLASLTDPDCNDSNSYIYQNVANLSSDNDQDGYTDTSPATQCVGPSTSVSGRTYYRDSSGSYSWLVDSQKLGTNDCNDGDAARWQNRTCYYDGDNDGYRTSAYATRCVGSDCTNSTDSYKRESTAPVDCDDTKGPTTCYPDADNDGYYSPSGSTCFTTYCPSKYSTTAGNDCDDSKAATTCYPDADGDGYYSSSGTTCFGTYCPSTYSTTPGTDCDDSNWSVWAYGYGTDNDGDNYGQSSYGCLNGAPPRTATAGTDCNDSDKSIWTYGYGIDNDGDNYGESSYGCNNGAPPRTATAGIDCCDSDADAHPGADFHSTTNACGSWDWDCDGSITKESSSCPTYYSSCTSGGTSFECWAKNCTGYTTYYTDCSLPSPQQVNC